MRTLRLSLAVSVVVMLLGGLAATASAQEDVESGPVTHFTGTWLSQTTDTSDEEWREEDDIGHSRGVRLTEMIEWSDPRLPSEKQHVLNFDMHNIGEFREVPVTGTLLLEGPEGYWTGEFTAYCDADGGCYGMNTITGHGAYEGLFAIFRGIPPRDTDAEGGVFFEGLIFEGEMPPMPEPLEPPAE
jgi:hypothetical protein